ncbi:MAG TPA: NAD(+) kinase [Candidatus Thiothrix moscowensis]|uniref:NAD(+) kinase n=1 Tax=unclassified Thiothrix TaxID=2636184 RepID=UPI0025F57CA4|nr:MULTISPECIES: NAD(+) kinase [unclassified Thiothrix]HRJ52844.1 NAD(+) kinase [Candidatus Thiothrix moscowensis]HRJ93394.1 NAD(+) kinase [Candidatus Thiothrix moscowensis]
MSLFSHIGIFTKPNDIRVDKTLFQLHEFLIQRGFQVFCDQNAGLILGLPAMSAEELARRIDLAIVVGGDGTLLGAGRLLAAYEVPIVGINLGRLGFLVDVSPDEMGTQLDAILAGEYREEQRLILHAEAERDGEIIGSGDALNDVVLHVRDEIRMIEFTTWIDGSFVNTQRADGIIITTPTGSTAYALSSGGPIMHPALQAIALVPVCPHTLSDRPLVLSSQSTVELQLDEQRDVPARVSFDGHNNIELESGDRVRISARPEKVHLLHPQGYDYFHILREKLHWGVQL